ncbi:MAG TPA: PD-(D/E)XK nuclease family protein [Acidimicrobiales bacterium]|nr:PD-(D/E)XK nuclease family protein [Acidimicrobiales bacterium]
MSLPLPRSLSPSKVASFKDCALAFRYSVIDHLPEPPSAPASKGTLVHRALERLFSQVPAGDRTPGEAMHQLELAWGDLRFHPEFAGLALDQDAEAEFRADAARLVANYFELEDPNQVRAVGIEVMLEADLGAMRLRGVIDRLELDPDGELVVTDYKTGRAPGIAFENSRLGGVQFYAFLCQQALGRRPARIQLLHLGEPLAIVSVPTAQSIRGLEGRASAVWSAVERACATEDFRPRPSRLCDWCAFRVHCPAFGGEPVTATPTAPAAATGIAPSVI